jgi:maltokinase
VTVRTLPPTADDEALVGLVVAWAPLRRWFPAKGAAVAMTCVGRLDLPEAPASLRTLLVRVHGETVDTVVQVPLLVGDDDAGVVAGDLVGHLPSGEAVRDAAGSAAYLTAFLAAADGPGVEVDTAAGRVITGEQSNTSVILPAPDGGLPVAICKVLRTVADGPNPDVDVPRRLVEVGWEGVPAPLAWLVGTWPAPSGGTATGYLGAVSAFVPSAEDGFELACSRASEHRSFAGPAHALGALVAGMHAALRLGFDDVEPDDDAGAGAVADALLRRFTWASSQVQALEPYGAAVDAAAERARSLPDAPARQRVHGDLHLGQVLRSGERWFVTDFEGEPLAPLADRTRPDLAVRDVAGLLRSYDYAAAVGGLVGQAARAWSDEARSATLTGYDEAAGTSLAAGSDTPAVLLRVMELDKALYECVYEARNRPDWLPIPLAGLDRLLG